MARFVFGVDILTRPVLSSPRMRPQDVAVLRRAFINTMRDPDLKSEMVKRFGVNPNPMRGEAVQQVFAKMQATPRDTVERVWRLTRPEKK